MTAGRGRGLTDVAVVGAGPAGLAVAAACAALGLRTVVVDPRPDRPWPQTFGAWIDELPSAHGIVAHRWDDVRVVTDEVQVSLRRPYGLLDNEALRRGLYRTVIEGEGTFERGRARRVEGVHGVLRLVLDDGDLTARAVVDASGHRPALLAAPGVSTAPVQSAYGIVGRFDRPPAARDAMTFMDLSTGHLTAGDLTAGDRTAGDFSTRGSSSEETSARSPSFLYAMYLGADRWLVEETCLAARPAVALRELRWRLEARLSARGAHPTEVEHVERVRFPMGVPVPDRRQLIVGFGAAAGMVHPATGFHVARALRTAPVLAHALGSAIGRDADAWETARAGWAAVWPRDALVQRRLHEAGLATLLSLDARGTQRFFELFFAAPPHEWQGYLSGAPHAVDVARTMARLFARAPMGLRRRMALAVARPGRGMRHT